MFNPEFNNRSEEGLELTTDGFGTSWDKEETFESYNSTYIPEVFTTSEALETEPQLADEQ